MTCKFFMRRILSRCGRQTFFLSTTWYITLSFFFTKLRRNICWFTFTYYTGFVSDTFVPDSGGFNLEDLDNFTSLSPAEQGDPDVLGSSQLGGAPLGYSQQQTPQPSVRPQQQMRSPDRHTYSQGHVHAQQRAKRVRHRRGG